MKTVQTLLAKLGKGISFWLLLILRSPYEALSTLLYALWIQAMFRAIQQGSVEELYAALVKVSFCVLLLYLYNGSVWTFYAAYNIRIIGKLRALLFQKMVELPAQQIERRSAGEWFSRLNSDIKLTQALFGEPLNIPFIAVSLVGLTVSAVLLGLGSMNMLLLVLAFVIPHALIGQFVIAKPVKSDSFQLQSKIADNASLMHSIVECSAVIRLYQAENEMLKQSEKQSVRIRKTGMKMHMRGAMGRGLLMLAGLGGFLVILVAAQGWIGRGAMEFAQLTALLQYRNGIITAFMMLLNSLMTVKINLAGAERVRETLEIGD